MHFEKFLIVLITVAWSASGDQNIMFTGFERISLNATRAEGLWTVHGIKETKEINVSATVPGGIYSDLEENGLLTSPVFHEFNDLESRWVGRTNWTYTRNFNVTQSLLDKASVVLICEGLDTVANVSINGIIVGQSENMFVRYVYDIKKALQVGQNNITVAFQSPVEYAQAAYKNHEDVYGYAVRPESLVSEFRGEDQVHFIRKMQSSFSWDWGPAYPSSGIWKDISIEGYNGAVMRDVLVFPVSSKPVPDETAETQWTVTARVYYDCARDQKATLKFKRWGGKSEVATKEVDLKAGKGLSVDISLTHSGLETKLWWPNGYGSQNLYIYNVFLGMKDVIEATSRNIRIGFRTVELVEDFVDANDTDKGREFYFRVNGVKMYSKGSNSIPLHVLPERITEKQTEWLLRTAQMSHQNMIRVWGGGMYESDTFYDWADQYGILIWQDFMFACALYPATASFLENVKAEVETQVKRLQYRPSLALWAGNNENEGGLQGGWFGYEENYKSDYVKLYIDTIKATVEQLDPSRRYLSSSPTNGKKTEEEGWVAENPSDLRYGDIHAYNYYEDNWDWRIYRRGRYSSEYGYQSFPHFETLAEVANNISAWTWTSPMIEHRQRHPGGQSELNSMIEAHFPVPVDEESSEALPYMLYMVQLTQVMGQKTQTEFYRRLQDKLDDFGTGHNMGALYWQLNDVWQGASWSSVEVNGRWKLQMYYAKNFFAPVLASPFRLDGSGDVSIELISDSQQDFSGKLTVRIYKLNSNNTLPVYEQQKDVSAQFLTSNEVFRIPEATLESLSCNNASNPCIVYTTLPGTPDNFLFLQYPTNKYSMQDPKLQITSVSEAGDGKTVRFTLTTETVAPFVFLTMRGVHYGYFSDNGFVQVTPQKELTFYAEDGITGDQFKTGIQVMSLFNVTKIADEPREKEQLYQTEEEGNDGESETLEDEQNKNRASESLDENARVMQRIMDYNNNNEYF